MSKLELRIFLFFFQTSTASSTRTECHKEIPVYFGFEDGRTKGAKEETDQIPRTSPKSNFLAHTDVFSHIPPINYSLILLSFVTLGSTSLQIGWGTTTW